MMHRLKELPLAFFTVLATTAVGALITYDAALIYCSFNAFSTAELNIWFGLIWITLAVAQALSLLHLGKPLRAPHAVFRAGASYLSGEVLFGVCLLFFGVLQWVLLVSGWMPQSIFIGWCTLLIILSVMFIWAMSRSYRIPTIPTWDNISTSVDIICLPFIGGFFLGGLLLKLAGAAHHKLLWAIFFCAALGCIVRVVSEIYRAALFSDMGKAGKTVSRIIPYRARVSSAGFIIIAIGLLLWLPALLHLEAEQSAGWMAAAFFAIIFGELIERMLFYAYRVNIGIFRPQLRQHS